MHVQDHFLLLGRVSWCGIASTPKRVRQGSKQHNDSSAPQPQASSSLPAPRVLWHDNMYDMRMTSEKYDWRFGRRYD